MENLLRDTAPLRHGVLQNLVENRSITSTSLAWASNEVHTAKTGIAVLLQEGVCDLDGLLVEVGVRRCGVVEGREGLQNTVHLSLTQLVLGAVERAGHLSGELQREGVFAVGSARLESPAHVGSLEAQIPQLILTTNVAGVNDIALHRRGEVTQELRGSLLEDRLANARTDDDHTVGVELASAVFLDSVLRDQVDLVLVAIQGRTEASTSGVKGGTEHVVEDDLVGAFLEVVLVGEHLLLGSSEVLVREARIASNVSKKPDSLVHILLGHLHVDVRLVAVDVDAQLATELFDRLSNLCLGLVSSTEEAALLQDAGRSREGASLVCRARAKEQTNSGELGNGVLFASDANAVLESRHIRRGELRKDVTECTTDSVRASRASLLNERRKANGHRFT
mmetsp:Transcript_43740/g.50589  ORF Transcript_43740/g.50589 Transcript_43740/m.50589 type:complete len:394 (+) Transcript_43740:611-1792(+)